MIIISYIMTIKVVIKTNVIVNGGAAWYYETD